MKRICVLALSLTLLLAGCGPKASQPQKYEATFLSLFDTVTTVVGYAPSEAVFQEDVQRFHDLLEQYHQLYDIYNAYDGVVNLKNLNDSAGQGPVTVDQKLMDLLLFAKEAYTLTGGTVNVAMGSVLSLWHDAREAGIEDPSAAKLPDMAALEEAAKHTNMEDLVLDETTLTAELRDPDMRLDVGAVAKGYAVEQVCRTLEQGGMDHMLVSVGGNVRAIGSKPGNTPWTVGIENPEKPDGPYLTKILATDVSVVTSGSYQRYYTVGGKIYHHIIDPKTLMPADYVTGVSVVCADSGLADALSTALFNLPLAEGQALLEQVGNAEAIWVLRDGTQVETPGFTQMVKP